MKCKNCLLTDDIVKIHPDGECEYCKLHKKLEAEHNPSQFRDIIKEIQSQKGEYNCLIGVSGGFDSAMLLHLAIKWGLSPYVMHFDNGYNTPQANHNLKALSTYLGIRIHTFRFHGHQREQYKKLCNALLMSGTPDVDIANDLIMTDLMYSEANRLKIKYILNGHNFRSEGSTPIKFTYMDAKYLKSIWKSMYKEKLTLPIFTLTDQIIYSLKGIKQIRPFYYRDISPDHDKQYLIDRYNLKDYHDKHAENTYTHYAGGYLLPKKFGIDKSIIYNSARIRSGYPTLTPKPVPERTISIIQSHYPNHIEAPIKPRSHYKQYNLKLYRPLIWMLVKIKALPYTFYKKYCT